MNKQDKGKGGRGIEWTDYTWNPVAGCKHACRWTMPDGSVAKCYAEEVAEGIAQSAYPLGFAHHYWKPALLAEPYRLKTPSRIFMDSMSDLMGHWVHDEQIQSVLDACAAAPWHTFQLLTKNAPRLLKFTFPTNVWVGVSAPPTEFMGKPLSAQQQERYMFRALDVFPEIRASVRWMSIEPLSFDMAATFRRWGGYVPLHWAVIGAASNGRTLYQPRREWVSDLLTLLDREGTAVFFKGNLDWPRAEWRESFPMEVQS